MEILQQEKEANAALLKEEVMEAVAADIGITRKSWDIDDILQSLSQQLVNM